MKRTLLLGSAWTASAAAAVGLGFLAISLVDASASSGGQTLAAALTTSAPASSSSSSAASPTSASTGSPAAVPAGQQVTDGGTVYGSCADGVPVVASAPAAGWWLDDSSDAAKIEFRNDTQKIEVRVSCVDGVAQFSVEGPRDDNSGKDDGVTTAPAATTHAGGDDSDGRKGGGHGADDGVATAPAATSVESGDDKGGSSGGGSGGESGDDTSGRSGGGHGSDG